MSNNERIVVVGLGYVGLPLAVALAAHHQVIGFDIDRSRIDELNAGHDRTNEVGADVLRRSSLELTSNIEEIHGADVYIVTVPTPVDARNNPDLTPLLAASKTVAGVLDATKRPIIVFESTVYPGVTEDICGPAIEAESGLVAGRDFFLGYSPERINPGDREHTVDRITKVVAGDNAETLQKLSAIYAAITTGGVFEARSIRVAEAAKVIENAQRDINIAFMNEIAQIFEKLGISVWDVLAAAGTKWNFLPFQPGLVGGHCIGVDPYYLSFRAQELGHDSKVILAGRSTNDGMGAWIADRIHARQDRPGSVLILGLAFKENVPDLRNSRVIDVIGRLQELGHHVVVHDPWVSPAEARHEYGLVISEDALTRRYDVVFVAVPHAIYTEMTDDTLIGLLEEGGALADLRNLFGDRSLPGVARWTL